MHVQIAQQLKDHPQAQAASELIRACVHCGFCNAACPTYALLGDELDGPRGRVYQIKSVLEGQPATVKIQTHLDRCLLCRACETACPSGVHYGRLLDLGRQVLEERLKRPWPQRLVRFGLRAILPYPKRLAPWVNLAKAFSWLLPAAICAQLPKPLPASWPKPRHRRRMLVLDGCVQSLLAPQINLAAAQILDRLGISLIRAPQAGCCGALSYHLGAREEGLEFARRNLKAWWPYLAQGIEAIVTTASGCGLMVKEYAELLASDPQYAAKAAAISAKTWDLSEVLASVSGLEELRPLPRKIAFHAPCTLQHGLHLTGVVERLLSSLGFELTSVPDGHLCCGSAGTYSLLQPKLARKLRQRKIAALESGAPDLIATANLGCLLYLKPAATCPVVHWVELLAPGLIGCN